MPAMTAAVGLLGEVSSATSGGGSCTLTPLRDRMSSVWPANVRRHTSVWRRAGQDGVER